LLPELLLQAPLQDPAGILGNDLGTAAHPAWRCHDIADSYGLVRVGVWLIQNDGLVGDIETIISEVIHPQKKVIIGFVLQTLDIDL
jgi:hypothetical protein